jgi:S-adenosylmethionine hydrolase
MKVITLLTDFGLDDFYVSSIKGILLKYEKNLNIIDITHNISHFDIKKGAFILYSTYNTFPKETIHFAIVDPGVGTFRDFLYMEKEGYHFFAPDNGILTFIYEEYCPLFKIIFPDIWIKEASFTFHGRDLFAPAVGKFLKGEHIEMVPKPNPVLFEYKKPHKNKKGEVKGSIIYIDRFGNCISNIPYEMVKFGKGKIIIKGKEIALWVTSYKEIPEGKIGILKGSISTLELAQNMSSLSNFLNINFGDEVIYTPI